MARVTLRDNGVTISSAGTYSLNGSLDDEMIQVDAKDKTREY